MNKKTQVIIWSAIIISMIALNVYVYLDSSNVYKRINESNAHTDRIVLIDKFRTDINIMSEDNKLYLLTGKKEYKDSYDKTLGKLYKNINDMNISGTITNKEKDEATKILGEYSKLNIAILNDGTPNKIDSNMEDNILKLNHLQSDLIYELDESINKDYQNIKEKNNTIQEISKSQKVNVQATSTALTAIISAIAYYIKKNPSKTGAQVGEIIDCIVNIDDDKDQDKGSKNKIKDENIEENTGKNEEVERKKEYDVLEKCIEEVVQYEKIVELYNLIYKESVRMKSKIQKSNEVINEICIYINQLRINIEECKDCPEKMRIELLNEIQEKLIELRILVETLPNYNELIEDISNEIIKKK